MQVLPPYSQEAEEATLGSLLIDPRAIVLVATDLNADDFYLVKNGWIYSIMLRLGDRADLLTVATELDNQGQLAEVGGGAYLAQLTAVVPTALNVVAYAKIVKGHAMRRRMIGACSVIAKNAYDLEIESGDLAELAQSEFLKAAGLQSNATPTIQGVSVAFLEQFWREVDLDGELPGIPSSIENLDRLTGGWRPGQIIATAGPTGSGKTTLMLNFAYRAAQKGKRVAFFSLEMSEVEIMRKFTELASGVNLSHQNVHRLTEDERARVAKAAATITELPLTILYMPGATVNRLATESQRLKFIGGLDMIIVDYLQIMTTESTRSSTRAAELGVITRRLKQIAGELGVSIFIGSQLNRESIGYDGKPLVPQLHHLKESGSIEQDSDLVIMLMVLEDEPECKDVVRLYIRKQREGPTGDITVQFIRSLSRFQEVDLQEYSL
ncbi:MAG: AAA family ATPase [Chloroflexi bacterium]|nr:AAA family ATPase [Chloroflexota bacterium]